MYKILLIDDEEAIVRVLSMSLKADGYDIVTAYNGEQGLEVFQKECPQIVLTDIKMPGMDGLEVLRRVKDIDTDVQVIIITGHGDIDSAIESLQYGASDFINKPVQDEVLAIALKRAIEKLEIQQKLKAYTSDLEDMCRMATEEFSRKSNFLEKVITSSNDGIIGTDDEWKITIFNPGAERIFGYSRAEVRDMDVKDLYPPEITEIFGGNKGKATMGALPWIETLILSKDGNKIPVRFSGTILIENKTMMGSVGFFQDLREIKRLERELVNAERLVAIGQTVAGMAHCIKNILNGFKGGSYLVDLALDRDDTNKLKDGWQMIQRNIGRTSDLVLDLLSYSKEREPEFEKCFPNRIANDACELYEEIAKENNIEIIKDFAPSVGEAVMDSRTVHRCLLNLISNAVDACLFDEDISKEHQVTVTTSLEHDGGIVRFDVEDNGLGMSEEVQKKLFGSFFSTKGGKGTGLGLLVTMKLIEEHNGTINVVSEEGKGTIFTVRIPSMAE